MYVHQDRNANYVTVMRAAAFAGDSWAQFDLGLSYLNGDNVPQDNDMAVYWFEKAAVQGCWEAQRRLNIMKKI